MSQFDNLLGNSFLNILDDRSSIPVNRQSEDGLGEVFDRSLPNKPANFNMPLPGFSMKITKSTEPDSEFMQFCLTYTFRGVVNIHTKWFEGETVNCLYLYCRRTNEMLINKAANPFYCDNVIPPTWADMIYGHWVYAYSLKNTLCIVKDSDLLDCWRMKSGSFINVYLSNNARIVANTLIPILPPNVYVTYLMNTNIQFLQEVQRRISLQPFDKDRGKVFFPLRMMTGFWPKLAPPKPRTLLEWLQTSKSEEQTWKMVMAICSKAMEKLNS